MTNIRIGFKTYRDIEKMDLGQLTVVRNALMTEVTRIQALPNNAIKVALVAAMDKTMRRNISTIDRVGFQLISKALPLPTSNKDSFGVTKRPTPSNEFDITPSKLIPEWNPSNTQMAAIMATGTPKQQEDAGNYLEHHLDLNRS